MAQKNKYEVSDPGFYGSLIRDQEKRVRNNKNSPDELLELGRLFEARASMTKEFVNKRFFFRYSFFITVGLSISAYIISIAFLTQGSFFWILNAIIFIFIVLTLIFMWSVRYPPSGKRHFKKVLSMDPSNADAYLYLGLIALRRYQKKKAYYLLERACEKGGGQKIEKELKTIYQTEFVRFFKIKSEKEKELCHTIERLEKEAASLKIEINNLTIRNTTVTKKAKNTRVKTGHTIKQVKIDMETQIEKIQNDYEKQIACLEQAMEMEEAKNESARKKNIDLNLQIMEAKAFEKRQTFDRAKKKVEAIMGTTSWKALSKKTRSCLATAEHAFSFMDRISDDTDFSLIGMELCKALETEINRKLVRLFTDNLNNRCESFLKVNKTGQTDGLPVYFTMLARVADTRHYPETTGLTLGQYLFVLKKTLEGEYALDEYGAFLETIFDSSGIVIGRKFLQKLKTVTHDYRNSIVHYSLMNLTQCHNLRDLVFLKDDSLLMDCCRIIEEI
ncbi:MAG: hypothetical protein GY729_05585 [Desulfobacteraceae bacterium]|nr:hypothetical protein [Desulfobacteraceae bacterium]